MWKRNISTILVLGVGAFLGYAAATGHLSLAQQANASPLEGKKTVDEIIYFEVKVPSDAVLEIDGKKMEGSGATRRFHTPPLSESKQYSYTLKATWGGKELTRTVQLAHGVENVFDMRGDFSGQASNGQQSTAVAQSASGIQTTGKPGSPSATTTIDGKYLPPPDPKFGGVIKENLAQSKAWWAPRVVPPKDAPNVLLILTDDVGFGAPSTFGGVIPTPALDRVAQNGLRYTNFHTTSLCSPTRAALITGRNHHSAGFGVITEISNGFPGYNSVIQKDCTTVGRILRDNGYATSWFGKNHNTPTYECTQLGPFNQWPIGMGFEYFYGFMGGDTDQWAPGSLHRNTTPITPWLGHPGWNLTTAMADDAIGWLNRGNDLDPSKRFMLYYCPGGTHAPHNPTPEWVKKATDMHLFDGGWNKLRDTIYANQKKLGVIPQDAKLTPWRADLIKNWDQLTDVEKKLFIRQADVYAAYLMYTDHEIGRVIQAVQDLGKLDNTLIIFVSGDNGASAEGSATGTPNEVLPFNGIELSAAEQMKWYDAWGTDQTCPHYSIGWAWALDTPFKWTKQIPSFFGGTRNGMCISWPGHITDVGGIRNQFGHVIDIVPTILEAAGIPAPQTVDGFTQKPIEGVSLLSTFKAKADAPSPHKTQYFEMGSVQGLYDEGWMLSAVPIRAPWQLAVKAILDPANDYKFELYDLKNDWTQNTDVAAQHPDKVKQMHELMFAEFKKYQVFPLDGTASPRFLYPRPSFSAGRTVFNYSGQTVTAIPDGAQPSLLNTSYTITANVEVPEAGADGIVVCEGGRLGGYGLYLLKSKPVFTYNLLNLSRERWEAPTALAAGKHTIVFDFKYDGLGNGTLAYNNFSGIGRGGIGTLLVDGVAVATKKMERTIPILMPFGQTFNIGSAVDSPLDDKDYSVPFPFTGKINKLTIAVDPPKLTPADIKKLQEGQDAAQKAR